MVQSVFNGESGIVAPSVACISAAEKIFEHICGIVTDRTCQQPSPPAYLTNALAALQVKYPHDQFEGTMRYTLVSTLTDTPISVNSDEPKPSNPQYYYYPRIKCKDCPGKLYTPGPLAGADNFEVHLKNRQHRDKVAMRLNGFVDR